MSGLFPGELLLAQASCCGNVHSSQQCFNIWRVENRTCDLTKHVVQLLRVWMTALYVVRTRWRAHMLMYVVLKSRKWRWKNNSEAKAEATHTESEACRACPYLNIESESLHYYEPLLFCLCIVQACCFGCHCISSCSSHLLLKQQ